MKQQYTIEEWEDIKNGAIKEVEKTIVINHYYYKIRCGRCSKWLLHDAPGRKICLECRVKNTDNSSSFQVSQIREKELEKQKDCIFCKGSENLQMHHIDCDRNNNNTDNLVILCSRCHGKLHGKIYNRFFSPTEQ